MLIKQFYKTGAHSQILEVYSLFAKKVHYP